MYLENDENIKTLEQLKNDFSWLSSTSQEDGKTLKTYTFFAPRKTDIKVQIELRENYKDDTINFINGGFFYGNHFYGFTVPITKDIYRFLTKKRG